MHMRIMRVLFTYQCSSLSPLHYYDLFMAAKSALSQPCLQHSIACMQVCSQMYMMENTNWVQQGASEVSPPCLYYQNIMLSCPVYTYYTNNTYYTTAHVYLANHAVIHVRTQMLLKLSGSRAPDRYWIIQTDLTIRNSLLLYISTLRLKWLFFHIIVQLPLSPNPIFYK